MKTHFLQAIKIVLHHANGRFDWLISGHQIVNPSRKAISVLSGKYKRFKFVHPVKTAKNLLFCQRSKVRSLGYVDAEAYYENEIGFWSTA